MKTVMNLLSYSMGPGGMCGGSKIFIETLRRINGKEGIEINVFCAENAHIACTKNGLKDVNYVISRGDPYKKFGASIYYLALTIKGTWRMLSFRQKAMTEGDGRTIVYSTADFWPDVIPAFARKVTGRNVYWVQKIFHVIPKKRIVPHCAQKVSFFFIRHFADLIIVDNNLLRSELLRDKFCAGKIHVNYPGINTAYLEKIKPGGAEGFDAVFMGRLHPSKGIFDLPEIWKRVCRRIPGLRLAVIGVGNELLYEKMDNLIREAGLGGSIKVLGYVKDEDAFRMIKSAKVFLFPSYEEGFGIAPLEAQACGVPVVAWALPVYDEIFPRGMVKIPIGEVGQFSEAVIKVLTDEEFRKGVARDFNEIAGTYSWETVVGKELALIGGMVGKPEGKEA